MVSGSCGRGGIVYFRSPYGPQRNETIGTSVAHVCVSQHRLDPVFRLLGSILVQETPFTSSWDGSRQLWTWGDSLFPQPSWSATERGHWDACSTRACVPTPSGPCFSAIGLILELKTAFTSNWDGSRSLWKWGIVYFCSPHGPQRNETIGTPVAHVRVPQHRLEPVFRLLGSILELRNRLYNQLGWFPISCGRGGIVYFRSPHGPQRNETIGTSVAHVRVSQHRLEPVFRLLGSYWS